MADPNVTSKWSVDIKDLTKNIATANKSIKLANAEFNAAAAGMDNWQESTDGIQAKLKQLNTLLDQENKKLKSYAEQIKRTEEAQNENTKRLEEAKEAYEEIIKTHGKGSAEAKKYKSAVNAIEKELAANKKSLEDLTITYTNQTGTVNRLEKDLRNYESQLEDVTTAEKAAAKSGKSVSDELKNIQKAAEDADEGVEELNDGFTVMKGAIASLVADGIKSAISGFLGLAESTREYRTELAKLNTISDEMGANFDQTKDAYKDLIATTGDEGAATEALNNLLSAGYADNQLDEITRLVEGTAIKWKDTLKAEGLADSIQEWIGSDGASLTGNFAEALERMGYDLKDVTTKTAGFSDEQRRQWVVNTLTKEGLGEVSDAYREQNKDLIEASNAQFAWNDQMANVGKIVEPVVTSIKQGFADVLGSVLGLTAVDLTGFSDGITKAFGFLKNGDFAGLATFGMDIVQNMITGVQESLPGLIESGANMLTTLGEGLKQNIPEFVSKGLDAIGGFAENLRENAPVIIESGVEFIRNLVKGLMDSLPDLISKVPEIVSDFAGVINDNAPTIIKAGVGIILDIIKGLLKAIPTLIKNIPKIITAIVDVWEAFNWLDLGKKAITHLGDGIKSMKEFAKTKMTEVNTKIVDAIKGLPQTLLDLGKKAMTDLGGAITSAKTSIKTAATSIYNAVWDAIKALPGKMLSLGKDIVSGLWNGISNMSGWIAGKIQGFGEGVLSGIKDFFGIHSPSTVMKKEVGWMLPKGMAEGVLEKANVVKDAMATLGNTTLKTVKSAVSGSLTGLSGVSGVNTSGLSKVAGQAPKTVINNFYQTNNSPKALNRWDIARQTRNQLAMMKG